MTPNRLVFNTKNFRNYEINSLMKALDEYKERSRQVKSAQLVKELKIKHGNELTTVGEFKEMDENGKMSIRPIYEIDTKKIRIDRYKTAIRGIGKTINGEIVLERIISIDLVKDMP